MAMWRNKRLLGSLCGLFGMIFAISVASAQAPNTCVDCHGVLDSPLQVTPETFSHEIHAQKGLTCASCHGGDPTAPGPEAMDKKAGFRGHIERRQIPGLCGHCHSDAAYMRQFNPSLRTDQLSQYLTSVHGKQLAKGDDKVAVCTDCHGVHDLRPASDTRSSVHPLNVAHTCGLCHADAAHMKGYGIPTDQFTNYAASVHHEALAVRGDLSAPTCTTCHGNHGAAPPGVGTVQNVCSTCHVFQAQLFGASPHKAAFQKAGLPGCVVCHSNHRVNHPTDAMLGAGPQSVCARCHTAGDAGSKVASDMAQQVQGLEAEIRSADELLALAESSGMEVSEARLAQDQARDALTKARVSIHLSKADQVSQDVQAGQKIAAKSYQAGKEALAERNYRRWGLGFSMLSILIVLAGLFLYIRQVDRSSGS